ncbi:hypothetical protein [Haloimpatiens lingqiaonensis]|nr:hypothetical protein [Haloimpatiens lingqiaonensis]
MFFCGAFLKKNTSIVNSKIIISKFHEKLNEDMNNSRIVGKF